ncbi:MAG TPA: plastocyanin/azurin family copper-binding protein [Solirubrobacterales bacterium]|nr:plastocyanin/azurin family copper-binding protein [Solirubrobacterales bacterium]
MRKLLLAALAIAAVFLAISAIGFGAGGGGGMTHRVNVPHSDRFTPFQLTIRAGDKVKWVNHDSDDHSVVADSAFDSAGHKSINKRLTGAGGTLSLRFKHAGTFVYYCRFHARLNNKNQPIAPGPDGGIQSSDGNFGTPMSGVITVLPSKG